MVTALALVLGFLVGYLWARLDVRIARDVEAERRCRDEYERAKRRGIEL